MLRYEEVEPIERDEAMAAFASQDESLICPALVRCAFHDPDWEWVEAQCLRLIQSCENDNIKEVALTCLGHVARIHGQLRLDKVLPVLRDMAKNPNLIDRVKFTLSDIRVFIGPVSL